MAKNNDNAVKENTRSPLSLGLSAAAFVTLAILAVVVATVLGIDMKMVVLGLGVLLALLLGIPAFLRSRAGRSEEEDESATCEPIIAAYRKSKSVDKLLADYEAWGAGEHTTYTRMHFGAQVIDELRDAKREAPRRGARPQQEPQEAEIMRHWVSRPRVARKVPRRVICRIRLCGCAASAIGRATARWTARRMRA